ncbi:hypothetical protein SGPA1_30126 [Streptomyces misionensis JCM 4497]
MRGRPPGLRTRLLRFGVERSEEVDWRERGTVVRRCRVGGIQTVRDLPGRHCGRGVHQYGLRADSRLHLPGAVGPEAASGRV